MTEDRSAVMIAAARKPVSGCKLWEQSSNIFEAGIAQRNNELRQVDWAKKAVELAAGRSVLTPNEVKSLILRELTAK